MTQMKNSPTIADYDASHYDYEEYWHGRGYEDASDKIALQRFLDYEKKKIGKVDTYIDIGGAYGREVAIYAPYTKQVILFDYSLNLLKKGKKYLESKGITNVTYVAGNIYFLPFQNQSIDAGQMIRVMHHLKYSQKALYEIQRVIKKFFVLEFANKVHFKYVIKSIVTLKPNQIRNTAPMQQTFRETSQGSSGDNQIFLNFHPRYIKQQVKKTDFSVRGILSVSNLRIPALKKYLGKELLISIEKQVQRPLAPLHFGPSMYYLLETKKVKKNTKLQKKHDLFCCPACKQEVSITKEAVSCTACKKIYPIVDGIYDLRYAGEME